MTARNRIDRRAGTAIRRFGAVFPYAQVLFADIENGELIVGHTAFGLCAHIELAHLGAGYLTTAVITKLPLCHRAVLMIVDSVEFAGKRVVVHTDAVDFRVSRADTADTLELPFGRINLVNIYTGGCTIGGHDYVH